MLTRSPQSHAFTTPSIHRLLGLATALGLAVPSACDDPESQDLPAGDAVESLPEPPQLAADELAALQAEATIAELSVGGAGRVTIVGTTSGAFLAYQVTGGRLADDVLRQLIADQQASPAEVFLALAGPGVAVPEVLLADHRARAARDSQVDPQPRQLEYVLPRVIEPENHGCLASGANPQSFASWVADWTARFNFIYFTLANRATYRNEVDGDTLYSVASDSQGRVLSACNAAWNDVIVRYWAYTTIPGPTFPYTYLGGATLEEFDAVHMYSTGSGFPMFIEVEHAHPDPDTYVAVGRCGGGC